MARTAFQNLKAITPVIDLNQGEGFLKKELKRALKPYHISTAEISRAFRAALIEQEIFIKRIKDKGNEIISTLTGAGCCNCREGL